MNPQPQASSSRRDFLTLGGLAATGSALTLHSHAAPTPVTEDAHGYIHYLQATGQEIAPEENFNPRTLTSSGRSGPVARLSEAR